jgi:large subunit ribosomal protein L25
LRQDVTVAAEVRNSRGKNEARRTRKAGQIPAVVYGAYQDPISVSVNPRELQKLLKSPTGYNSIFTLAIGGGESTPVMVVDKQVDPIRGTWLHADLKRIDLTKRIRVTVPVHTAGEPKGVKVQGGLLEIVTRSIDIECLPDEIPESFTAEVGELLIGQSKRASDIAVSGSMKLISPPDQVIAHIVSLRAEEVAATPEVAAPAAGEPEVVKKGKKEDEPAAEEKGKKK